MTEVLVFHLVPSFTSFPHPDRSVPEGGDSEKITSVFLSEGELHTAAKLSDYQLLDCVDVCPFDGIIFNRTQCVSDGQLLAQVSSLRIEQLRNLLNHVRHGIRNQHSNTVQTLRLPFLLQYQSLHGLWHQHVQIFHLFRCGDRCCLVRLRWVLNTDVGITSTLARVVDIISFSQVLEWVVSTGCFRGIRGIILCVWIVPV
mmetsp:Transcript_26973/g.63640  ORF Transcript_26973/g.63640 Transcript_26973/m.63640 type:complete len:200 (-) Transcript_26973:105-704(-)